MRRLPIPMGLLDTQVEDVRTPFDYSAPSLNVAKKRDWRASMFDRLVPQGDANMDDADKTRSFRQGLLQLAAGLQSGPNFGEALTKGLTGGLLSMNQGVDDLQNRQYKQQLLDSRTGDPTEFRALDMQAKAAGYEPGTPGYQHFMRVRGGLESKASSAGYKFEQVPGRDGKPRIQRSNPNTGEVEIYDESTGDFVPVGQSNVPANGVPLPAPTSGAGAQMMGDAITNAQSYVESRNNPNAVSPKGAVGDMQTMPSTLRDPGFGVQPARDNSPEELHRVGVDFSNALRKKYGPEGGLAAYNWGPGNWEAALQQTGGDVQKALALAPRETRNYVPAVQRRANPALVVGQSPGEKSADEALGKATVDLSMQPRIEAAKTAAQIDTTNSRGAQTNAVAAAKEQATTEAAAAGTRNAKMAQKTQDAQQQLPVLSEIKRLLPFATNGVVDNMKNRTAGFFGASTKESQTDAKLRPLAARILQTVPRFEGPQSDRDVQSYKDAAGDLANPDLPRETRMAALAELERLARKAAGPSAASSEKPRRLKFNPATGRLE